MQNKTNPKAINIRLCKTQRMWIRILPKKKSVGQMSKNAPESIDQTTTVIMTRTQKSPNAAASGAATLSGSMDNFTHKLTTDSISSPKFDQVKGNYIKPIKTAAMEEEIIATEKDISASSLGNGDMSNISAQAATNAPPITARI